MQRQTISCRNTGAKRHGRRNKSRTMHAKRAISFIVCARARFLWMLLGLKSSSVCCLCWFIFSSWWWMGCCSAGIKNYFFSVDRYLKLPAGNITLTRGAIICICRAWIFIAFTAIIDFGSNARRRSREWMSAYTHTAPDDIRTWSSTSKKLLKRHSTEKKVHTTKPETYIADKWRPETVLISHWPSFFSSCFLLSIFCLEQLFYSWKCNVRTIKSTSMLLISPYWRIRIIFWQSTQCFNKSKKWLTQRPYALKDRCCKKWRRDQIEREREKKTTELWCMCELRRLFGPLERGSNEICAQWCFLFHYIETLSKANEMAAYAWIQSKKQ